MGIFDNVKEVDGKFVDRGWVEWQHFLIPNYPDWLRLFMRIIAVITRHCLICTALSGCYFKNNKHPQYPHHDFCDCLMIDLKLKKAKFSAYCDIAKFSDYIFSEKYQNGKRTLFEDLGYSKNVLIFWKKNLNGRQKKLIQEVNIHFIIWIFMDKISILIYT